MNLTELTKPEQSLVWDQGFMTLDHPKAERLLAIVEALKASGFDLATVLSIVKGIQKYGALPTHFSIINNRYLSLPTEQATLLLDIDDIDGGALKAPVSEQKLVALTFWL